MLWIILRNTPLSSCWSCCTRKDKSEVWLDLVGAFGWRLVDHHIYLTSRQAGSILKLGM